MLGGRLSVTWDARVCRSCKQTGLHGSLMVGLFAAGGGIFYMVYACAVPREREQMATNGLDMADCWCNGSFCCVLQILDCWADPPQEGEEEEITEAEVEALLSRSLAHPYIVNTFQYGLSKQVSPPWCASALGYRWWGVTPGCALVSESNFCHPGTVLPSNALAPPARAHVGFVF